MDEPEHLSSGVEAVEATVNDLVARVALLAQDLAGLLTVLTVVAWRSPFVLFRLPEKRIEAKEVRP